MSRLLLAALCALPAWAAVDGIVLNRTTGRPQPNTLVTLYRVGAAGMEPVESVQSGAGGAFSIDAAPQGAHLIQAIHSGVVYNQMIQPGAPLTGLSLEVYDSTSKPEQAAVTQHMVLLEPMGKFLHVNESVLFANGGNLTYNNPAEGTLRFYLPPDAQGEPKVMATAPNGMPVDRPAVKTGEEGVYRIDFPLKPGETRFDLTWVVPQTESGLLSGKALHRAGPLRIVVPEGVSIEGGNIRQVGQEPQTRALVYEVEGAAYTVKVSGTGSLRTPQQEPAGGERSSMQQILPPVYDRAGVIVGLALLILALGFAILYRRGGPPETRAAPPPQGKG